MLAALLCALLAQQPAPPSAPPASNGLILGRVVDAGTGLPIGGAVVTLSAPPPFLSVMPGFVAASPTGPGEGRVIADAQGRFVFRGFPAGRQRITATAAGYIPGEYGQRRPAGPGQIAEFAGGDKIGDLVIRLWKGAAVNGAVLDEAGEPVGGVQVRAMRRVFSGGRPQFTQSLVATTDDRGAYRMANLTPGDYVLAVITTQVTFPMSLIDTFTKALATGGPSVNEMMRGFQSSGVPSMNTQGFRVGDFLHQPIVGGSNSRSAQSPAPSEGGPIWIYPTTYFPAATGPAEATVLTLGSAEDRAGVDLRLRLVPGMTVSGTVTGPDGAPVPTIGVRLVPENTGAFVAEVGMETAMTATDAAGRFSFLAVPPGAYVLKVLRVPPPSPSPPPAASSAMIGIGGGAQMGSAAPPPPAAPPPVSRDPLLFASQPLTVGDREIASFAVNLQVGARVSGRIEFDGTSGQPAADQVLRMSITLLRMDAAPTVVAQGRATADGAFATVGYPPGKYLVVGSLVAPGWTMRSAMLGGRDVSDVPFDLGSNDIAGIAIKYTDRTTEISGTVTGNQGRADTEAEVLVFPADTTAWREFGLGLSLRRARNVRTSKSGGYSIAGLPPGEYFIAAVSGLAGDWQDPKLLEALSRTATRITLSEGEVKVQGLRSSPIR